MKVKRKIVEIDDELCDGCGQCVPACAEGAIQVIEGKARLLKDRYCDGLGACLGDCPKGALHMVEREAEEFDEEAVEALLESLEPDMAAPDIPMACGCPSSQIQEFEPEVASGGPSGATQSSLSHWPVQIQLVPPTAPFLRGADLLVAADCTPFAYPDFHRDFVQGKAVLVGCPKFDDVEAYVARFTDIFRSAGIRSITVVVMEVPCCSSLPVLLEKAMEKAEKRIPMEVIVLSTRGRIMKREELAVA
ncbi:MAG: 4Fe-4S binding protein [Desulfobacteraceae bacterium]|jgi:ferredoxin